MAEDCSGANERPTVQVEDHFLFFWVQFASKKNKRGWATMSAAGSYRAALSVAVGVRRVWTGQIRKVLPSLFVFPPSVARHGSAKLSGSPAFLYSSTLLAKGARSGLYPGCVKTGMLTNTLQCTFKQCVVSQFVLTGPAKRTFVGDGSGDEWNRAGDLADKGEVAVACTNYEDRRPEGEVLFRGSEIKEGERFMAVDAVVSKRATDP